jgi:hypothetical protein
MTTAAFDGEWLVADRLMGSRHTVNKIFDLGDGRYLTGCGDYCQLIEVAEWLKAGSPPDAKPDVDGDTDFLLIEKGRPHWLTVPYLRKVRLTERVAAVGSGSQYALGAMAAGADARKAVQIATTFDPSTGKGIDAVRIKAAK